MKLVSWNVSGINSCIKKGLINFIKKENADLYCFQEVKSDPDKINLELKNIPPSSISTKELLEICSTSSMTFI